MINLKKNYASSKKPCTFVSEILIKNASEFDKYVLVVALTNL